MAGLLVEPEFNAPAELAEAPREFGRVARAESSRVNVSMIASSPVYVSRLGVNVCSAIRGSMTHGSKLALVPLNLTELGGSCGDFRASEEHLVVLG